MDYLKTNKGKVVTLDKEDYPVKIHRQEKTYRIDSFPKGLKMQDDNKTATPILNFETNIYR